MHQLVTGVFVLAEAMFDVVGQDNVEVELALDRVERRRRGLSRQPRRVVVFIAVPVVTAPRRPVLETIPVDVQSRIQLVGGLGPSLKCGPVDVRVDVTAAGGGGGQTPQQ